MGINESAGAVAGQPINVFSLLCKELGKILVFEQPVHFVSTVDDQNIQIKIIVNIGIDLKRQPLLGLYRVVSFYVD